MKILIVAATSMEVKLLTDELHFLKEKNHFLKEFEFLENNIEVLIAGMGILFTSFHLTNLLLLNTYDLVINMGIAGSFTRDLQIGEVVQVTSDELADLGIEKKDEFLTLFESGFIDFNEFPFEQGVVRENSKNMKLTLKKARGITTNKSHGRTSSIAEIKEKFSAQVESMEGLAWNKLHTNTCYFKLC